MKFLAVPSYLVCTACGGVLAQTTLLLGNDYVRMQCSQRHCPQRGKVYKVILPTIEAEEIADADG